MASKLYSEGRKQFAMGDIKWKAIDGDIFKAFLVDEAYSPLSTSHRFISDIPESLRYGNNGSGLIADAVQLVLHDPEDGICGANNIVFSKVVAGKVIKYLVIFKNTGVDETSPLICFIESAQLTTTNGGNLAINFDTGPNKIFKL